MRVVDAKSPYPTISTIVLNSVPRPGDGVMVDLGSRRPGYTVKFVQFDPNDAIQIALGCVASESVTAGQIEPAKINEFIQTNEQSFQKAESYSKTMIGIGYVSLFAIWSFVQGHLSHRAILTTALLAGFSLLVYIAWEAGQMFQRSTFQLRFNRALMNDPAINNFVEQRDEPGSGRSHLDGGAIFYCHSGFLCGAHPYLQYSCGPNGFLAVAVTSSKYRSARPPRPNLLSRPSSLRSFPCRSRNRHSGRNGCTR